MKPYKITSTKFLGKTDTGNYSYEITFNQSIVHTGRFTGIEQGLDKYRENEIFEHEKGILEQAEDIKNRKTSEPSSI